MNIGEPEHWTESFFGELYFQFDLLRRNDIEAELKCLEKLANIVQGAKVCDVACGWGRLAIPLVKRKRVFIIGIDKSKELLSKAKSLNKMTQGALHLLNCDIRFVKGNHSLDSAFMFGTSFGYYAQDDINMRILVAIRSAFRDGAPFVISQANRPKNLVVRETAGSYEFEKISTFDEESGLYIGYYRYYDKNSSLVIHNPFRIKLYSSSELELMLDKAGFSQHKAYGDFFLGKFEKDSELLIIRTIAA
jgi:hypothetical protein